MSEMIVELKQDHVKISGCKYKQDLVRCGECEHCEIRNNEEALCHQHGMVVDDRYFCADGVKGRWTP